MERSRKEGLTYRAVMACLASIGCIIAFVNAPEVSQAATPAMNQITMTADVTGDGKADVLAVDASGQLLVYPGDMSVKPIPFKSPQVVGWGWSTFDVVAPGDFNGDGKNDLIGRERATGNLFLYLGSPNGGVARFPTKIQIGWGWNGLKIAAGLFTSDTFPDLVAAFPDGTLRLYVNSKKNSFLPAYDVVGSGWQSFVLLSGGDFNKDGKGDIFGIAPDGILYFYANSGNGRFGGPQPVGDKWTGLRVASGVDFDQNNYPDIITADSDGDLWLYPGAAGCRLDGKKLIGSGWGADSSASQMSSITATPDITGDGKPDVVVVDARGQLLVYPGDMSVEPFPFTSPQTIGSGWSGMDVVAPGDFDGDGKNDLIGREKSTGNLFLYLGSLNGGVARFPTKIQIGWGWSGLKVAAGLFTSDAFPDLVAAFPDGTLRLYVNSKKNTFLPAYDIVGSGWQGFVLFPGGDFNKDGTGDILGIAPNMTMYFYPGLGDGKFGASKQVQSGWDKYWLTSGVDFDQNGYPDILAADSSGDFWLYPGVAGAKLGGRTQINQNWAAGMNTKQTASETIVGKVEQLAWPDRTHKLTDPKPEYLSALITVGLSTNGDSYVKIGASCDAFVATVMRSTGLDSNYRCCGVANQMDYLRSHPEKYLLIDNIQTISNLLPGDIFVSSQHTLIYIGNGQEASASYADRTADYGYPVTFKDSQGTLYEIYRLIQ